ncbi:MAG: glycosyltransferase [Alphaproteobacteria bacterium]|nr:MAG: glycosyltransferase [Alphaproteobacteria bacterium]
MQAIAMQSVTVVMTPRERFGVTQRSYESLRRHTQSDYRLVVVDGGSPPAVRDFLAAQARETGFKLVRRDYFLAPNEARNLALGEIDTAFVAFVDNDVLYSDGWLDALLDCARETGADIVAPLTCIGDPPHTHIHMAGGDIRFIDEAGGRAVEDGHRLMGVPLADVAGRLRREPCDFAEFHCMLVRRSVFAKTGPLDEGLKTTLEHVDFCMSARQAGARIWFEPGSLVTYFAPPPLDPADIPFYVTRWNDAWGVASMHRFMEKWHCRFDVERRRRGWIERHRRQPFEAMRARLQRLIGWRATQAFLAWRENRIIRKALAQRPA